MPTILVITNVKGIKIKMTKKKEQNKLTTKRKFFTEYAIIVQERGIGALNADSKRMAMKRKTRKQRKPLMGIKTIWHYVHL